MTDLIALATAAQASLAALTGLPEIGAFLLLNLLIAIGLMLVLWLVGLAVRDVSFIDGFWGLGMVLVAMVAWLQTPEGDPVRKGLLVILTTAWGVRLGWHLLRRWRRHGPDARYVRILGNLKAKGWSYAPASLVFVFLTQAPLLWLVSLPAQLGQIAYDPPLGLFGVLGGTLALFGLIFETMADAQLERFKADPENKGKVLDTGLWRYTRHPNYFGDACVWWGLWLIAAETGPGLWAVVGPLFLTWTLTRWSGAPTSEASLRETRPEYADYIRRTSAFIPLPPKRKA